MGLGIIANTICDTFHHHHLESWLSYFTLHGASYKTVETNILGLRVVLTTDPENIKALLSTHFEDYGKGDRFHQDWAPFLGDSIFTTDSQKWRASRQLIRPQFLKQRISDLSIFEKHIQVMLACISEVGNGGKVDLNDLFLRYTLDVGTEFLLGKSVDSLRNPADGFAKAFEHVQKIQNIITRAG